VTTLDDDHDKEMAAQTTIADMRRQVDHNRESYAVI
jgi:hypothetical protein